MLSKKDLEERLLMDPMEPPSDFITSETFSEGAYSPAEVSRMARPDWLAKVVNEAVISGKVPLASIEISSDGTLKSLIRKGVVPRVFLSHSHRDKKFVRNLATKLKEENIYVWVDEAEIQHGESLIEKLHQAIDTVDIVVAVLSTHSVRSRWVEKEIDIAMNREIDSNKTIVIPLLRDRSKLPRFLKGKLYADFSNSHRHKKNYPKLVESIYTLTNQKRRRANQK